MEQAAKALIETEAMSIEVKRTACSRDCPDACEILATVEAGRITKLRGANDHPVTQGFLCHRTSRFLERQYSDQRLTTPLVRKGGQLQSATWDDALDRIATAMLRFRQESGAASILNYRCGGSMGIMKHVSDWFFQRFGPVTVKSGDVCSGAGETAQELDFGHCDSNDIFDIQHSRTVVLWGKNLFVSSVHLIPIIRKAREQGTRIILIDPVRHRTEQLCDLYLQPRPGADAMLALAVARWLFDHDCFDAAAADYCDGFEAYRQLANSRKVEQWAELADVVPELVYQFAECYADGPAAILLGWGMQRRRFGATTVRAIDALASVAGNVGVRGGGVSFYCQRRGAFDFSWAKGPAAARTIPEPLLGPGILAATDPPIRMAWVSAANPVAMLPESNTVRAALESRELTVVVDAFLTDTAQAADIVLPTSTFLEEEDLIGSYGHHWIAEMKPVVAPPTGVLSDYQIIQALARRVGLAEDFSDTEVEWKRRLLTKVAPHGVTLERLQNGAMRNPLSDDVVFAERVFSTPSGKINLMSELPSQMLVASSQNGEGEADSHARPKLRLAALSTAESQASQWVDRPPGHATATIHPSVAPTARAGQVAVVRSSRGELKVVLQLDERQRKDILLMAKGGWLVDGQCANALVSAELTDDGECAVYYDTEVELQLC